MDHSPAVSRWLALIAAAAAMACSSNTPEPPQTDGGQTDGGQTDGGQTDAGTRSFDPTGFDRTCATDGDCVLVEPISDCSSCCNGAQSVRNTPALDAALSELHCPLRNGCAKICTEVAVCENGRCEKTAAHEDGGADGN